MSSRSIVSLQQPPSVYLILAGSIFRNTHNTLTFTEIELGFKVRCALLKIISTKPYRQLETQILYQPSYLY